MGKMTKKTLDPILTTMLKQNALIRHRYHGDLVVHIARKEKTGPPALFVGKMFIGDITLDDAAHIHHLAVAHYGVKQYKKRIAETRKDTPKVKVKIYPEVSS